MWMTAISRFLAKNNKKEKEKGGDGRGHIIVSMGKRELTTKRAW